MLRYASFMIGAIASLSIAVGISTGGNADDNQKSVAGKEPAAKGDIGKNPPRIMGPEELKNYDLSEIEETPPPELDADPTLEKPAVPQGASQKKRLGSGTKQTERAIPAALIWLANHQNSTDGSWSLEHYTANCKPGDKSCAGPANIRGADAGATAMGLLPFLAAGQTQKSKGPYKNHISRAIDWLIKNQKDDGNLAHGAQQMMYSHGLATIALSEDYSLSGEKRVGQAAQRAIDFIAKAENEKDGGWRYNPGDSGDTSVLGWQLSALKSAHMSGLTVPGDTFKGAKKFLDSVAVHNGIEYSYQPGAAAMPGMTAVGLLARQYLGAEHDSPMLAGGAKYLAKHLPDEETSNIYYWYYATQVLHNMPGKDWETWNGKMRDLLVRTQVRDDTCAKGSWDPAKDAWGRHGGRVMMTSFATLSLEVYYRYLPLYKPEAARAPTK
jgi:hypothetical protein